MTTVKEFRAALEALVDHCWMDEENDFIAQMENEEPVLNHVFLSIFTIHNALLEADGLVSGQLKHILQNRCPRVDMPENYFLCTNADCGVMNHEVDPIPERLVLSFEEGEKIPAGCCKKCGSTVVSL